MASISTDSKGNRRILAVIDGKRRAIRVAGMSAKDARYLADLIEDLAAARLLGRPIDPVATAKVENLSVEIRDKLALLGLLRQIDRGLTCGEMIDRYINTQKFRKVQTRKNYEKVFANFADSRFDSIPSAKFSDKGATAMHAWLIAKKYASATVSRRILSFRTLWTWANHEYNTDVCMDLFRHGIEAVKHDLRKRWWRIAWVDFRFAVSWFWFAWVENARLQGPPEVVDGREAIA